MIKLTSAGISIDKGVIPPLIKQPFKLFEATISIDMGTIPPKNYFREKIMSVGISLDKAEDSFIYFQIC